MTIKGIDVSNNNRITSWSEVAKSGVKWAYAKACEGATWHDPTFAHNYAGMKSAGILRGAYGFARPATSKPADEANTYVRIVEANGGFEIPPMLDLEDAGGKNATQLQSFAREWWSVVEPHWHGEGKPFLYSGASFIQEYGLHNLTDIFNLWIADYGVSQPPKGALIWQHTQAGKVSGIDNQVDLDTFFGSYQDLLNLCKKKRNEAVT